jgi:DNA-binding transcriptional LysR family regulator
MLLSEFGRSLVPHLSKILEEAQVAKSLADNFRLLVQVPIRIGIMSTVGHVRFSRFLALFQKEHEGVEVAVSESDIADLKEKLNAGELDVAVLNPMEGLGERFHAIDLYAERYLVILPPDHRLARQNVVELKDLSGEAYVDRLACEMREMVASVCREKNVELYARFRSEREDWVQAMVLARIGFAFMPEYSVTLPGLIQRALVGPEVGRTISLATVPGRPYSPAVAAFVRTAQTFAWPG